MAVSGSGDPSQTTVADSKNKKHVVDTLLRHVERSAEPLTWTFTQVICHTHAATMPYTCRPQPGPEWKEAAFLPPSVRFTRNLLDLGQARMLTWCHCDPHSSRGWRGGLC